MIVELTHEHREQLAAEAERAYPHECCGLLIGRTDGARWRVGEVVAARNEHAQRPHDRYVISPHFYMVTDRRARASGWDVIGVFHSHPDREPRPSTFDAEHAWPGFAYLIQSVRGGKANVLQAWQFDRGDDDAMHARPVSIA